MGLTRKQAIRLHRELWDWLYENPEKGKDDWPRWEFNEGKIKEVENDCFLCELAMRDGVVICEKCILSPIPYKPVFCLNCLYDRWHNAETNKTRKKYAAIIRDLPERGEGGKYDRRNTSRKTRIFT